MDAVAGTCGSRQPASSGAAGYPVARLATIPARAPSPLYLGPCGRRPGQRPARGLAPALRAAGCQACRPVAEAPSCAAEPVRRAVPVARMALEQRGYASTSDALLSLAFWALCLALLVASQAVGRTRRYLGAAVAGHALWRRSALR
ncbi:MAG: hypothetical protein ACLTDR_04780 [Adlercreutzia equolifaciens]